MSELEKTDALDKLYEKMSEVTENYGDKDEIEAVVFPLQPEIVVPFNKQNKVLSFKEAMSILKKQHIDDISFYVWTKTRVYFTIWVDEVGHIIKFVPRNPYN